MTEAARVAQEAKAPRLLTVLGRPALLAGGLVAAGWMLRDLPSHGFAYPLARMSDVAFIGLGAAACAVGVPRQIVAFAGGYGHGTWPGTVFALGAQMLGCLADMAWARAIARDHVRRWTRKRLGARVERLDVLLAEHPFAVTLTLRLLPIGNNLALNLFAGGFGLRFRPFLLASLLGYVPQTLVFVLLGSGVRLGHDVELPIAGGLMAVSMAIGLYLLRRQSWIRD